MPCIHPGTPMLLEQGGEFGLALARGAGKMFAEIHVPQHSTPDSSIASASPQEFLCVPLGPPRSSVAAGAGLEPGAPRKNHACTTCVEELH